MVEDTAVAAKAMAPRVATVREMEEMAAEVTAEVATEAASRVVVERVAAERVAVAREAERVVRRVGPALVAEQVAVVHLAAMAVRAVIVATAVAVAEWEAAATAGVVLMVAGRTCSSPNSHTQREPTPASSSGIQVTQPLRHTCCQSPRTADRTLGAAAAAGAAERVAVPMATLEKTVGGRADERVVAVEKVVPMGAHWVVSPVALPAVVKKEAAAREAAAREAAAKEAAAREAAATEEAATVAVATVAVATVAAATVEVLEAVTGVAAMGVAMVAEVRAVAMAEAVMVVD